MDIFFHNNSTTITPNKINNFPIIYQKVLRLMAWISVQVEAQCAWCWFSKSSRR